MFCEEWVGSDDEILARYAKSEFYDADPAFICHLLENTYAEWCYNMTNERDLSGKIIGELNPTVAVAMYKKGLEDIKWTKEAQDRYFASGRKAVKVFQNCDSTNKKRSLEKMICIFDLIYKLKLNKGNTYCGSKHCKFLHVNLNQPVDSSLKDSIMLALDHKSALQIESSIVSQASLIVPKL